VVGVGQADAGGVPIVGDGALVVAGRGGDLGGQDLGAVGQAGELGLPPGRLVGAGGAKCVDGQQEIANRRIDDALVA
jgi:hypothetical protein